MKQIKMKQIEMQQIETKHIVNLQKQIVKYAVK